MNKAFLLTICLLLTSFTGCLDEEDSNDKNEINFQPENTGELNTALVEWGKDSDTANSTYGEINTWDTSLIIDMSELFRGSSFNGDISDWDVSSVTDMRFMFLYSSFNQDISGWDVSSVTDTYHMFYDADFNGNISEWDVSNVTNMEEMFYLAESFNQDISGWDVSNVTNMHYMFAHTDLSDDNKCAIHTSFSSNDNWEYDWDEYCSDE